MTNRPSKIKLIKQNDELDSDHSLLLLKRSMKIVSEEEQYMNVSKIKKIDSSIYDDEIMKHKLYYETMNEDDIDKATENIIKIIQDVNKILCP